VNRLLLALAPIALIAQPAAAQQGYEGLVASHAAANGVPASLVHRVIMRESRYNPGAVGRGGAMGMMQIKLATARSMGYTGSAAGLLDANTNMTYAVKYLAGAYRAAGGSESRAVGYYASGYYYAAKRQGWAGETRAAQAQTTNPFAALVPDTQPRRLTRAERRAQARAVNPFSAFAFDAQPRRLTRAERRAAQRGLTPGYPASSNQL
jgi:soluble lytic murein transglycosylase-like protein